LTAADFVLPDSREEVKAMEVSMTLSHLGNTLLRTAITRNLVSFPAQVQSFMRRTSGDLQERIVQLYFVRGWSVRNICERYGLSKAMAHKLLAEWRIRAVESGYIQEISPGLLDALVREAGPGEAGFSLHDADYTNAVPMQVPHVDNSVALSAGSGV
jgi:transposase-like protein